MMDSKKIRFAVGALAVSAAALVAIATHEGYRGEAYEDAAGIPTIGYGETAGVKMGDKTTPGGTAPTGAEAYLTDIVGEREVTVKASVEYNGQTYEAAETVKFGEGPLAVFEKPLRYMTWNDAARTCGRVPSDSFPGYHDETNLPRREELQAVSGPGKGGYGAAFAAKWPNDRNGGRWFLYWTGELDGSFLAKFVGLHNGDVGDLIPSSADPVAVCRRGG